MRIISGSHRGKQLHPPSRLPVRPTTDFAKVGLFNILNNLVDFEELRVLDLFAGTGSISLEFLSRGAGSVVAVDKHPGCAEYIGKTAQQIRPGVLESVRSDAFRYIRLAGKSFDLIFADPPYDLAGMETLPSLVLNSGLLVPGGWFILEHSRNYDFTKEPGFDQERKYGNVHFSFFRAKKEGED
ncbi:MAG TPA: RsmD family RNA methyltransferase [Bacteroidales bacterium]|nr:RsmD family RNA methyltransferase [Bacteroidales bacterium]